MTSDITQEWLQSYRRSANLTDTPNYFATKPQDLIAESQALRFSIGNGHQIFTTSIIPACLQTEHELILVTCFWAKSSTRTAIAELLVALSEQALARNDGKRIQVRICFSSTSVFQKLFQTSSLHGKIYPPAQWTKLGLPRADQIKGVDLLVKSIFVLPFSVMHPKFLLVDRHRAFVPSCNVSWESWFEGCVEMQGGICSKLLEFYNEFWTRGSPRLDDSWTQDFMPTGDDLRQPRIPDIDLINYRDFDGSKSMQTILLPSPHHISPRFQPFSKSVAPATPLNTFILKAVSLARNAIYIQTPNVTAGPLLRALESALARGVNIKIVTSSNLMILEQLVTAFTTTSMELSRLRRSYNMLLRNYHNTSSRDPEAQIYKPGNLSIQYYTPRIYGDQDKEPVKSHLKLTIIDDEVTILGSGNMDRASWFTSQELGVAIIDSEFARNVAECTAGALTDRVKWVLNS